MFGAAHRRAVETSLCRSVCAVNLPLALRAVGAVGGDGDPAKASATSHRPPDGGVGIFPPNSEPSGGGLAVSSTSRFSARLRDVGLMTADSDRTTCSQCRIAGIDQEVKRLSR